MFQGPVEWMLSGRRIWWGFSRDLFTAELISDFFTWENSLRSADMRLQKPWQFCTSPPKGSNSDNKSALRRNGARKATPALHLATARRQQQRMKALYFVEMGCQRRRQFCTFAKAKNVLHHATTKLQNR